MCCEVIFRGKKVRDISKAEELLKEAGLVKTEKFAIFCDTIAGVMEIVEKIYGNMDKVVYDYDDKSGASLCHVSILNVGGKDGGTMELFRYVIGKVDEFTVEPSDRGLSISFTVNDIFMEENLCLTA